MLDIELLIARYQPAVYSATPGSCLVPFMPLPAQGWAPLTPDTLFYQSLHERLSAHLLPGHTAEGVAIALMALEPAATTWNTPPGPGGTGPRAAQAHLAGGTLLRLRPEPLQLPANTVAEFAYYGGLLANWVAQLRVPLRQELGAKGPVPVPNEAFEDELLLKSRPALA